ncbi:MAG TPA: alkaline phosphatase family protein [Terriglobales bacterium]|nr:alkaline phosphatase family protein [Terriglobales bacterium]
MHKYTLTLVFLIGSTAAFAGVTVSSPSNNSSVSSPVSFVAHATTSCSKGVAAMGIYTAPGVLAYKINGASLSTSLSLGAGTYNTVVQDWDNCGGYAKAYVTITVKSGTTTSVPRSSHVFLLVEENHRYSDVIGNASMPYLNSLANKYGLATQYYANTHPSIGNYLMLTAGQIITNNDSFCGTLSNDNIVRHLLTAGKTWKAYAESLPGAGYTGCDVYPYAKRHNPLSYFTDVANSSEKWNLVPFTQFHNDLINNHLPQFSFIVPNLLHDAHDGSLSAADSWLKSNIAPLIASAVFQKDGILVIVFDEAEDTDTQMGGGHVAAVVIGPKVKGGYKSSITYQHQSTLKMLMEAMGLTSFPGAASKTSDMRDLY